VKIGRNDPCHCGSGKKYKKCHQAEDEARAREEKSLETHAEWVEFHGRALRDIARGALDADAIGAAAAEWFGDDILAQPLDDAAFLQHALYDRAPADGQPAIADAAPADRPLSDAVVVLRAALAGSHASLHEVTECKLGRGVRLKDHLTELERWVADPALSERLQPLEVVFGRIVVVDKRPVLLEGFEKVAFRGRKKAITDLKARIAEADLPADEAGAHARWLRANAPTVARRVREARA
jgi:hypothetical protein